MVAEITPTDAAVVVVPESDGRWGAGPVPSASQLDPTISDYWEWVRTAPGELAVGPTVEGWFRHSLKVLAYLLDQVGMQSDGSGATVLDVAAGTGYLGKLLRMAWPQLQYHATEQSLALLAMCQQRAQPQASCVWQCSNESGPKSLVWALEQAKDEFFRYYSVVILNHVLDCVPWPLTYRLLDACWQMVQPGNGFLFVNVQRHLVHRVHAVPWTWDMTIGHLAQYSQAGPVLAFDDAMAGNLIAAAWRPPLGTPTYPMHALPGE